MLSRPEGVTCEQIEKAFRVQPVTARSMIGRARKFHTVENSKADNAPTVYRIKQEAT